ncbi:hypothetical protein N7U66_10555 [Lacinutrix neustonica]|uniref:Uncharacterized protein n=1 Tax=Lacinutrix neustonica TaxID=2980107 RepID=A0A9E8SFH9_9FLAO|nr:hypothetical protein [Lacinutrix neustonica]WAC03812.1 hypothetical protein N7U66_10555 [Lacinutrix neustonica]
MKKILIFIICLYSSLTYCQNEDLYILINNEVALDTINAQNDSISLKIFRLNLNSNNLEYEFYINEKGKLGKRIFSKSRKLKLIELIYKNVKDNNPQILINEANITNWLTYEEILNARDFENLINTIKSFDNVYISNKDDKCNKFLIAKKVTLKNMKAKL